MLRVAWYRFRATFGRRWSGLLALVLLIGLVGGLALGVLAGARRTQSSYPAFLKSTNPSDLGMFGLAAQHQRDIARPRSRICLSVKHAESYAVPIAGPIAANGAPTKGALNEIPLGSIDGLGFNQDRLTVTHGRRADPNRADEVDGHRRRRSPARRARERPSHDRHVHEPAGAVTRPSEPPRFNRYDGPKSTVVGIVMFNNTVVQDDVDVNGEQEHHLHACVHAADHPVLQPGSGERVPTRRRRAQRVDGRRRNRACASAGLRVLRPRHVGVRGPGRAGDQTRGHRARRVRRDRGARGAAARRTDDRAPTQSGHR